MSALKPGKHVAVINRGSLSQKFVELCRLHNHEVDEVVLEFGKQVTHGDLNSIATVETAAALINMHETSSGALQEMKFVSDFCRARGLIIDTASTFVADEIGMAALGADVILAGSQKALACNSGGSQSVLEQHVLLGTAALLSVFHLLGTGYKHRRVFSKIIDEKLRFDASTKVDFECEGAVASIKVAGGAESEGELVITGTEGYVYVPAPWWKTDYFEVRFEDSPLNVTFTRLTARESDTSSFPSCAPQSAVGSAPTCPRASHSPSSTSWRASMTGMGALAGEVSSSSTGPLTPSNHPYTISNEEGAPETRHPQTH